MVERTRPAADASVHSLDHFALAVPSLDQARTFYADFGLDVKDEDDALALYAPGSAHRWAVVRGDARRHLDWLSFGAYADGMPKIADRLDRLGVATIAPPRGAPADGLWFHDMDGLPVHVHAAAKSSPDVKSSIVQPPCAPGGERGACTRSAAPAAHPRRLSHVLRFTPDVLRAVAFYEDVLGMRLSDRSGDGIAFLHAVHGSDHHVVAFAKSSAPGYHHSSWDMAGLEDVGLGGMQMAAKGHARGWGPGRHVLGSNYFWYVQDPWGSFAEYSADIDYVPKGMQWRSADYPPEDAFYLWGPDPPSDFVTNYEATVR
jgi:catechol 2,3-dioxygenase